MTFSAVTQWWSYALLVGLAVVSVIRPPSAAGTVPLVVAVDPVPRPATATTPAPDDLR
jgi:hypothetical protein